MLSGLTEGRIVHYVLENGNSKGQHRPAIVVKIWRILPDNKVPENGCCQLQVFTDDLNDGLPAVMWKTSVTFDEAGALGSWHWPEKVE